VSDAPPAEAERAADAAPPAPWVGLVWIGAAFLSAVCGIGGGLFAVPLLHYLGGLPLKRAVATSLVLVFVQTATGTIVELLHAESGLDGPAVALLIAGGYLGARVGFALSRRIHTLWLKRIFALVLVISAVRILGLDVRTSDEVLSSFGNLSPLTASVVAVIGFSGGVVAPLLGVGGGLIVIPALLILLPGVTYIEARACSTAMSVFTASQSAAMHWQAGNVERKLALRFALMTAFGAAAGVLAVHQPGWADGARTAMAVILLFVAARFAWDGIRGREPQG
jgi:uncharacterized membrane protein YfcA